MTVALAGSAPATFEIKSANLPLVALLLKSTDLTLLAQELEQRFAASPGFFDDDPLVLDLAPIAGSAEPVDFARLIALLRRWHMAPVAFKGASAVQSAAARAAGLAAAPDAALLKAAPPAPEQPAAATARAATAAQAAREAARHAPAPEMPGALMVHRQVRSGQQIYARGRDLVVLANVNAGAEVIADGHVHIYGSLRGKAIAGARGDVDARIFTISLEAELIAIAGTYRTSETPLPPEVLAQPTQVRLVGDKLLMEPLKS